MPPPIGLIINLLRDPQVSNKAILNFVVQQLEAIGYTKILSAILGAAMVGVSLGIKIPQIKKIVSPSKLEQRVSLALGLSRDSVRLETLAQFIHVTYNKQEGNAFVNYGESLMVALQNIALLLLLEYYRLRKEESTLNVLGEKAKRREALKALVRPATQILALVFLITRVAPRRLILTLQVLIIPLGIAGKFAQIRRNAILQSTASLSHVTVGANVIGSFIRVFTTLSSYKKGRGRDKVLLAGYLASFVMNAILAGQMIQYKGEAEGNQKTEKVE